MKPDEMRTIADTVKEMNESSADLLQTMKEAINDVKTARRLWRDEKRSRLTKLGLALIVCPEPTPISETIGSCLVAAGVVQKAIKNQAIYVGDVYQTFEDVLRGLFDVSRGL